MKRARANIQSDAALALSSGKVMIDFELLPAPVTVQRKVFQFCLGQNLGIGFLSALRADQKAVFIYFHIRLLCDHFREATKMIWRYLQDSNLRHRL